MKPKLLPSVLLVFCLILLLFPISKGEAQGSEWIPAWVDISDSGIIHVLGQTDRVVPKLESPIPKNTSQPVKPIAGGASGFISRFFSALTRPNQTPSRLSAGWETIFSDDFEGAFPGPWNVFDNDSTTNGEYYWAQKDCRPYAGSSSAWVVGAGADGSALSCGSDYPDYANSWMIYGPFSLADATDAELRLMFWLNTELTYDPFFVGASVNGINFYGATISGTYDWTERIFDLSNVDTLGDLTGEPQVWVVIAFQSDYSITSSEGVYVDDIELRKYVGDGPTPTSTSTPTPTLAPTPTSTPTSTPVNTPVPNEGGVYLPLINKEFPFVPDPPVLNPISNDDGDGNYTVSWSPSEGASAYTLEEDDNQDFSSPAVVSTGSGLSTAINGRAIGKYYYRVRASNPGASSAWSNLVTVDVTVPPPACPQTGAWSGTTSQGRSLSFEVENSPNCQIKAGSLRITVRDSCYAITTTTFALSYAITNNHFDTGSTSGAVHIIGDFTSATTSDGTFSLSLFNPWPPPSYCTASGTWTATP